jgi:hypothetical protein
MKVKEKKVYYCEFCKKHSLSASSMSIHEKHCTLNPTRECRVCKNILEISRDLKPLVEKYSALKNKMEGEIKRYSVPDSFGGSAINGADLDRISKMFSLADIKDDVDGCPMCTLAIIRQSGVQMLSHHCIEYDFKKELADFWQEENDISAEADLRNLIY